MSTAKRLIEAATTTPSKSDSKILVAMKLGKPVPKYTDPRWVSLVNKDLVDDKGDHYVLLPMGLEDAEWHIEMGTYK